MQQQVILGKELLQVTLRRLCQEILENHGDFSNSVLIGLQPRGIYLAKRIQQILKEDLGKDIPLGELDITFHRDDFRRRGTPLRANATNVPFLVEGKKVVLVDDVLFTGRSVRAALDAMTAFGRPEKVELLALIDRCYTRELPIEADYVGKEINSMISQKVNVQWEGVDGGEEDKVWLVLSENG